MLVYILNHRTFAQVISFTKLVKTFEFRVYKEILLYIVITKDLRYR